MNPHPSGDAATSNQIGMIIMVAVTIIIAALLLAQLFEFLSFPDDNVPDTLQITNIRNVDNYGRLNNEGWVTLENRGTSDYVNWNLYGKTYVNDNLIDANILTMNGVESCGIFHNGIHTIGGAGTGGGRRSPLAKWYATQTVYIDYNNNLIHPGDRVTIEFYNKSSGAIISRDTWPRTDPRLKTEWWLSEFTHPGT